MTGTAPTRSTKPSGKTSEGGFTLLLVIFLVAALTIALAVALPNISKQIQRDREIETMHRGLQYERAIKMYYKTFSAYPPSVDALVKGVNNIRFLRKKYTDPMTGKDDWKPILFGQNKVPTAMGFFGQPLGGTTVAGIGPSGGNQAQGGSSLFSDTSLTGASGSTGASGATGSTGATGSSGDTSGGPTFGGGGIIGFEPGSPKESILVYKKKNHYNEWEFTYDPAAEQMMMSGGASPIGATGSTGPTGSTTPTTNTPSTTESSSF